MATPQSITGWSFGHDLQALTFGASDGGTEALALDPTCRSIQAAFNAIPDTVAGVDGWEVASHAAWCCGPGVFRGVTNCGFHDQSDYPAGTNSTGKQQADIYKTSGTAVNARSFTAYFAYQHSIRSLDLQSPDGTTGNAPLTEIEGRLIVYTDPDNLIGFATAGTGASGGGLSTAYAHAGMNIIVVRSDGTNVKVNTFHQANTVAASVAAVPGSGTTAIVRLLNDSSNKRAWGSVSEDHYWATTVLSDADVALLLAYGAAKHGLTPFKHFVPILGDSFMCGFYGFPGTSIPNQLARRHPTWCVYNRAHSGAGVDVAATPSILAHQIAPVRTACTVLKPAGGKAIGFLLGGANDITPGGRTAAQVSTDLSTCVTNLKAAVSGGQSPLDGVIMGTPISRPQIAYTDPNLTGTETIAAALQTLIKAKTDVLGVVDFKGSLSTPTSNTAANLKAMVQSNRRWCIPMGLSLLISKVPAGVSAISSATVANPTVITQISHGLSTGDTIYITASNSTPVIDGIRIVTVITEDTYTIPVNVTNAGSAGNVFRQSADGIHLNIYGQAEMLDTIEPAMSALLGGNAQSHTARRLLLGV